MYRREAIKALASLATLQRRDAGQTLAEIEAAGWEEHARYPTAERGDIHPERAYLRYDSGRATAELEDRNEATGWLTVEYDRESINVDLGVDADDATASAFLQLSPDSARALAVALWGAAEEYDAREGA